MRRILVLLTGLLAATSFAAPAQARDVCVWGSVYGNAVPQRVDTGYTCAAYQYGVICEFDHYWVGTAVQADVNACVPRPV